MMSTTITLSLLELLTICEGVGGWVGGGGQLGSDPLNNEISIPAERYVAYYLQFAQTNRDAYVPLNF